ncbi:MAG: outer membrane lipoprotein-sorting protein [Spirochaetes bacterium]|nr:outer membrane lipoprotein-sorting protein [Spirochaetota bacterium]
MKKSFLLFFLLIPLIASAETADEIINKVDQNQLFITQKYKIEMTIKKGNRELAKEFFGYGQKDGDKAFMEFTNREDLGVKYLKLNDELWIYFPDADDIMKISGHMLKQGLMGSDISYEDLLETEEMKTKYESKFIKSENFDGRDCYVIEANAKVEDASYQKQILFIDKEKYIPLKIEMYAKGGRLLKNMLLSDIRKVGSRYVPWKIEIQDKRRRNSKTTLVFKEIIYDINVPENTFTRRSLKK